MNLSNDYILVLDEIRSSKKMSVVDLCGDLITERTYYRMLKSNSIKIDIFSSLIQRLGVDLTEFTHYALSVRKNDSRFKFIYRVHTQYYRDIKEHYDAMLHYQDPVEELQLLIQTYIKKYEHTMNHITTDEYHTYLKGIVAQVEQSSAFNIYLFTIKLLIKKECPESINQSLSKLAKALFNEEFSYSVIMIAICYDELLDMLISSTEHNDSVKLLMSKFEAFMPYFPIRHFLMRLNLYKSYLFKIELDVESQKEWLFKFLMNAMTLFEPIHFQEHVKKIEPIFNIDISKLIIDKTTEIIK